MEIGVGQAVPGETLDGRQVHHAAECRRAGVAEIIEQDDQHIGRARRRFDLEDGRRLGTAGLALGAWAGCGSGPDWPQAAAIIANAATTRTKLPFDTRVIVSPIAGPPTPS